MTKQTTIVVIGGLRVKETESSRLSVIHTIFVNYFEEVEPDRVSQLFSSYPRI